MKTASLRQVQHNLGEVLRWVNDGEEVEITRRRKPVAKLVPLKMQSDVVDWDEHARALRATSGKKRAKALSASELVIEQRNERP